VVITGDVTDNKLNSPCSGNQTNRDYTYQDVSHDCDFVSAELGGTIYPGSDADLGYYFEYSNDATFQCNEPRRPGYIKCARYPESGLLPVYGPPPPAGGGIDLNPVCIGLPCKGETLQDSLASALDLSSSLEQPREWFAHLVVTDGPRTVTGGTVGFVPADQVNPPLFDPRLSNPSGPGYQLKISCPSACPELQFYAPFSVHQTSGSDSGQLKLDANGWNPSDGDFTGTITGLKNIDYRVSATISLSTIQLTAIGYCATGDLGCSPQDFTLRGDVTTYGYVTGKGYYQPDFGGPLEDVRGGTWSLCYIDTNSTQCVDGSVVKSWAQSVGSALTWISVIPVAGEVAEPVAVAGLVTMVIANDPPDRYYKRRVRPARVAPVRLPAILGLSRRAAAAWTSVMGALDHASADGISFVSALQRYEGAVVAKDRKWTAIQLRATLGYGRDTVAWYQQAMSLLGADHRLLARSALGRKAVNTRAVIRALRAIREHGLSSALVQQLKGWGIDAATIRAIGKDTPISVPSGAGTLFGPILDPTFRSNLRSFTRALNTYLADLKVHRSI
jgi:hypothetical protein